MILAFEDDKLHDNGGVINICPLQGSVLLIMDIGQGLMQFTLLAQRLLLPSIAVYGVIDKQRAWYINLSLLSLQFFTRGICSVYPLLSQRS